MQAPWEYKEVIDQAIDAVSGLCFRPGKVVDSQPLLTPDKDYLSILTYGLEQYRPDFNQFIHNQNYSNGNYGCVLNKDYSKGVFSRLKASIRKDYYGFFDQYWTAQSVSRPLALQAFGDSVPNSNRTFLFWISDGIFNGTGDPIDEIRQLKTTGGFLNINQVIPKVEEVQFQFLWKKLSHEYSWYKGVVGDCPQSGDSFSMELYELVPLVRTFAIESLLPFEKSTFCYRQPDGTYRTSLALKPYNNREEFSISNCTVQLRDTSSGRIIHSAQLSGALRQDTVLSTTIRKAEKSQHLQWELKFWVDYNTSVYPAMELHPHGSESHGSRGLHKTISLAFEANERFLFGSLDLTDWLYKTAAALPFVPNTQIAAVVFWDIVSLVVAIILILLLIQRLKTITKPSLVEVKEKRRRQ